MNSVIWHRDISFKVSFLLWRALRNKLPTNDKITPFAVEPATCSYCIRVGLDNNHHICVADNFANHVWQYFSKFFGIIQSHIPF